jgi:hypothetical protein
MELLKSISEILHLSLLKLIPIHPKQYYSNQISLLEPKLKIEIIVKMFLNFSDEINMMDKNEQKEFQQSRIHYASKLVEDDFLMTKFVMYLANNFDNNFDNLNSTNDIIRLKQRLISCCQLNKYEEATLLLERLEKSHISQHFVLLKKNELLLVSNKDLTIDFSQLINILENLSNFNDTQIESVQLGLKSFILAYLTYLLIKIGHNDNIQKYAECVEEYYNKTMIEFHDGFEFVKHSINRNYFAFLQNFCRNSNQKTEYRKKVIESLEYLIRTCQCVTVNNIMDLLHMYNANQDFKSVIQVYIQFQSFLHQKLQSRRMATFAYSFQVPEMLKVD